MSATRLRLIDGSNVEDTMVVTLGANLTMEHTSTGGVQIDSGAPGGTALDDLNDVNAPSPADEDFLVFDTGAAEWRNRKLLAADIVAHDIISKHSAAGLTSGHFLKADSATTFSFQAHGLTYSDVGAAASGHNHSGVYAPISHEHSGADITSGTVGIGYLPTITVAKGGTNITSYTTGDILYASSSTVLAARGIGSTDDVLTVSGGVPVWAAPAVPAGVLLADGTVPLTANWDAGSFNIRARQFTVDHGDGFQFFESANKRAWIYYDTAGGYLTFTVDNDVSAQETAMYINAEIAGPYVVFPTGHRPSFQNSTTPFSVAGTDMVPNLNADRLDGNHASAFLSVGGGLTTNYIPVATGASTFGDSGISQTATLYNFAASSNRYIQTSARNVAGDGTALRFNFASNENHWIKFAGDTALFGCDATNGPTWRTSSGNINLEPAGNVRITSDGSKLYLIDTGTSANEIYINFSGTTGDRFYFAPAPGGTPDWTREFSYDFDDSRWKFDRELWCAAGSVQLGVANTATILIDGTDGSLTTSQVGIYENGGALFVQARGVLSLHGDRDGTGGNYVNLCTANAVRARASDDGLEVAAGKVLTWISNTTANKILLWDDDYGLGINTTEIAIFLPVTAHIGIRQDSYSGTTRGRLWPEYCIRGVAGTGGLTAGDVAFFWNSGTLPRWYKADADLANFVSAKTPLVGIAMATASAGNGCVICIIGGHAHNVSYGVTCNKGAETWLATDIGLPVYVSAATAGVVTKTPPAGAGDIVYVVGYICSTTAKIVVKTQYLYKN